MTHYLLPKALLYAVILVGTQKQTTSYTCYCHLSLATFTSVFFISYQDDSVQVATVGQGATEATLFNIKTTMVQTLFHSLM